MGEELRGVARRQGFELPEKGAARLSVIVEVGQRTEFRTQVVGAFEGLVQEPERLPGLHAGHRGEDVPFDILGLQDVYKRQMLFRFSEKSVTL